MPNAASLANLRPPWQPGQSGNPQGRTKDRARLETLFTTDMLAAWERSGKDAIERVLKDDPAAYLRIVAALMPKVSEDGEETLTRDRVNRAIRAIESWIEQSGDSASATDRAA